MMPSGKKHISIGPNKTQQKTQNELEPDNLVPISSANRIRMVWFSSRRDPDPNFNGLKQQFRTGSGNS